jgi:hypothetical protein
MWIERWNATQDIDQNLTPTSKYPHFPNTHETFRKQLVPSRSLEVPKFPHPMGVSDIEGDSREFGSSNLSEKNKTRSNSKFQGRREGYELTFTINRIFKICSLQMAGIKNHDEKKQQS